MNHPAPIRKRSSSISVKVVQAEFKRLINGRLEFTPQNQTFVDLTEATASVGVEYVMVTADGLKIDDSSETQATHIKLGIIH